MGDSSLKESKRLDRRQFVGATAAVAAAPALASLARAGAALAGGPAPELEEATIATLQAAMTNGSLTALALVTLFVKVYLERRTRLELEAAAASGEPVLAADVH